MDTLKHLKNDVMEISKGNECGLNLADFNDLRVGDVIEQLAIGAVDAALVVRAARCEVAAREAVAEARGEACGGLPSAQWRPCGWASLLRS